MSIRLVFPGRGAGAEPSATPGSHRPLTRGMVKLGLASLEDPKASVGSMSSRQNINASPATNAGRLEFLDAMRGVAAVIVALQHCIELVSPRFLRWSVEVWRPGEFGVVLFFLCSGFIIPASLEKYGSLRRFWLTRFFRLYPLYWVMAGVILILHYAGHFPLDPVFRERPAWAIFANSTMAQYFMNVPMAVGAAWTLSYELVFYAACSLLLVAGAHRAAVPNVFAVACLAGGTAGFLPAMIFSNGRTPVLYAFAGFSIILFAGLVLIRARCSVGKSLGVVALAALSICLLLNRWHPAYLTFSFFSAMFAGTLLYRHMHATVSGKEALGFYLFAAGCIIFTFWLNIPVEVQELYAGALHTWRPEALTFGSAFLVFGLAYLARRRRFPRWLTYLGTISYSVYLSHALLIHLVPRFESPVLTVVVWMLATLGASVVTYHLIERPAQDLGHRVAKRYLSPKASPAA